MTTQAIKGNLARLLATENLIVEHRNCSTAQFNVDTRVLTLPNWDKASNIVYDLLVGHEVGHALFTPNEDWRNVADCPMDFINVVEDARIEKLMKRKYPGLRRSFAGGYKELHERDFFEIADEDLNTFSLIDRINLNYKIGASAMIPFESDERQFLPRIDDCETFEEALQIAVDIYNYSKKEKVQEPAPEEMQSQRQSPEGSDGDTMTHEEMLDEAQRRESENENSDGGESVPQGSSAPEGGEHMDEEESRTQRAFDENAKGFTDRWSGNNNYIEIPDSVNLPDYVADWTEVHDWIDSYSKGFLERNEDFAGYIEVQDAYREFRKQSQKEVNYLVKEFECRKSADAYARSGESKTGVLDTSKLHTYKYSEDIFKKVTVVTDGKNHGLLFLLDWSGSMQHDILAAVKQVLNMTAFCKKVQIPFEVYAFTNDYYPVRRANGQVVDNHNDDEYFESRGCEENKVFLHKDQFHLMNFVSSRSNSKDYERMCYNLFREAYAYVQYVSYQTTPGIGLSGTPLNEAVVMLNYIIPQFKKQNDLQKVNVCILTDGESCMSTYGRKYYSEYKDEYYIRPRRTESCILRDRKTGITYSKTEYYGVSTNNFIQQVRDRNPGVNVLGFRIGSASQLSNFVSVYGNSMKYADVQKQWKKEKSAIIPDPKSFTALYALSNNSLSADTEFEVESGAKKAEITRAFKKMLASKSTNKKLLNSFIQYVA